MVEINNQRKAFLDMLAWSEGIDNGRQKTRNHGYDVIVGGELFTDYSDHPRKLVTLKSKTQINRPDATQLLSRWWMPTASSLAWKTSLRKSDCRGHCSRLRRAALTRRLIAISVRQSDRYGNEIQFHCRALVMVSSSIADSLIAKFKEAGGTVREIDVWAESPWLFLLPGYLHHRLPVMYC